MIFAKNWSKSPPKYAKMSKYQKSKKQVLLVSQMSTYSEKMRENEAIGEDFYILEGNFRSPIGHFPMQIANFREKVTKFERSPKINRRKLGDV